MQILTTAYREGAEDYKNGWLYPRRKYNTEDGQHDYELGFYSEAAESD